MSNINLHKELAIRDFLTLVYEDGCINGAKYLDVLDLAEDFIEDMKKEGEE